MGRKSMAMLLSCIILATVIGLLWSTQRKSVMAQVEHSLAGQLSEALGSRVTVGEVEISSFQTVKIKELILYDKEQQLMGKIPEVTVSYHPLDLLLGKSTMDAISTVRLMEPSLWLKQKDNGRWNIEDIWADKPSEQQAFRGEVVMEKGQVSIQAKGHSWSIQETGGSLDFSQYPALAIHLSANYKGQEITLAGQYNAKGHIGLTAYARELPLADWQPLLPDSLSVNVETGTLQQAEVTLVQDKGQLQWAGAAQFSKVGGMVQGTQVEAAEGSVTFANQKVYVWAKGIWQQQPVKAAGTVTLGQGSPVLALQVSSGDFDTQVIGDQLPLQGKAAFDVTVSGSADNPNVDGWVQIAALKWQQYAFSNIKTNLHLADGQLAFRQLSLEGFGGNVTGQGEVSLKEGSYSFALQGQHMDVSALPQEVASVEGYADVFATVKGKDSIESAEINGMVSMAAGRVVDVAFEELHTGFRKEQSQFILDYLNVNLGKGKVSAAGKIEGAQIQLQVFGTGVPLERLNGLLAGADAKGTGRFSGTLFGTLQAPEFSGEFSASEGRVYQQPFAQATGTFQGNKNLLEIKKLAMNNGPTTHELQGTIGLTGTRDINVTLITRNARAENLVALLSPGERITGNVNNEVVISGPLDSYKMEGHLLLTDGSFRGQLLAKGEGRYYREKGRLWLQNFTITSLNTQIALSGSVEPDKNLDLSVTADPIDLERLHLTLPYPIKGQAKFVGKLTGTPDSPIFNGQIAAERLNINHQEFTQINGQIALHGQQLDIPTFEFHQGNGSCTFSGGLDMGTNELYGGLEVQDVQIESILPVFQVPDKGVTGRLQGNIRVAGTTKRPNLWLTGSLTQGTIKKYPLDFIQVNLALENNVLKIYDLSARQGNGVLKAVGTADLDGPINLQIGGQGIDAGLLSAWLDMSLPTQGQLQFAAQITGTAQEPHGAVSLEVNKGGIGATTFDSLYGLFVLEKNNIQVNQILLRKGPYRASAYGNIPVAALRLTGQSVENAQGQMDLKVRLDEADLSILPLLSKEVAWASGPTQGEVAITGTLASPILQGSVTANGGSVKLAVLQEPIQNVAMDIQFVGDTIQIKKFSGTLGEGRYQLAGSARLKDLSLSDYNLSLQLEQLGIKSKYFTGPVNGTLKLSEEKGSPQLSGKVQFENDTVNIPALPEFAESNWNMLLDVDVSVGKKVRLYNPMLYDLTVGGHVHFGGSVKEPAVNGRVGVLRGTISYLGTQFKVQEGRADFTQLGSFEPVLRLTAQARLLQTVVNLTVNGPARSMQFALTSEPAMNQQQIISLLTLRSRYFEKGSNSGVGREELSSMLDMGLQARFVGEVESQFRDKLGLDEFRIVRDTASELVKKNNSTSKEEFATATREVYNLEVGKYISDKLLFNYTVGLDYKKNEWAFRYDLNRHFSINGSLDDQHRTWFGLETRYRF